MKKLGDLDVTIVVSDLFEENCYIVRIGASKECVVIDPGLQPEKIVDHLLANGLTPAALLVTHGHADHIGGNETLKKRWPACPIVVGAGEAAKLVDADLNLSRPFGFSVTSPAADVLVQHGDVYEAAGLRLRVAAIPGHSSGHVVYILDDVEPNAAFVGDVIMQGSIGRTDFPDGDFDTLTTGIQRHLFSLPDDTVLLSGHGAPTSVGQEKRTNPFVGESSRFA